VLSEALAKLADREEVAWRRKRKGGGGWPFLPFATTVGLIERLTMDKALRRNCGFSPYARLPSEATFSRAFTEFASMKLCERAHEALIKEHRVTN
jgi:hypothetical protein